MIGMILPQYTWIGVNLGDNRLILDQLILNTNLTSKTS